MSADAASIRAALDHPIVDADGHIVEEWQADFWDPETKKRAPLTGNAVFKKAVVKTR